MKDRIEFRFTVATGKVETKALKVVGKIMEKKFDRIVEAATKVAEAFAEHLIREELNNENSNREK